MLDAGLCKGGIKVHRLNLSSLDKHVSAIQFLCIIEISNNSRMTHTLENIEETDN